jgi:hypothetical protein
MKISSLGFACLIGLCLLSCSQQKPISQAPNNRFYEQQLQSITDKAVAYLGEIEIDSMTIPRSLEKDGSLHGTGSRSWTSGFYPGQLWQLYEYSQNQELKEAVSQWTAFIEKEKFDTHTHDLGFKVYCSFGHGYRLTQNDDYKEVILQTSQTLIKRYNEKIGCIRSWDFNADIWQFPVIIDNMMNLEMLFEATKLSGDSTYYKIAHQHALTTLKNHIREDFSSYHVIDYDTLSGEVRLRQTHQGFSDVSSWARGQAWNLYGFSMCYRETGDKRFLEQAKGIAEFFYTHPRLPEDLIPYWDFDAPHIPNEPRDASAAAIATCGLLMLCDWVPESQEQYLRWADKTLAALSSDTYQSNTAPFLLKHSVGSVPDSFEVDVPIVYADYYYVEALMKRHSMAKLTQK